MSRPCVVLELQDLDAAAALLDALRGRRPRTHQEARKREVLAERLAAALLPALAASQGQAAWHCPARTATKDTA